jgi:hypothetical protein
MYFTASTDSERIGTGDVEKVTQFREELLVVGSFGCGGVLPS